MKEKFKKIFKRTMMSLMSLVMVVSSVLPFFNVEEANAYSPPQTISGTAHIRLVNFPPTPTIQSETGGMSSASFAVTMPDGKVYTGYCMEHRKYTPLDGTYSFTGTLRNDGSYDIVINSNYIVTGRHQVHPREVPRLAPNPIYNQPAQKVGWFKYSPPIPKGELRLKKSVANNKHLTDLVPENYSLAGAVYGVYTNSNATGKVGELTTDASGNTNSLSLNAGKYYVKEITAPNGYKLDTNVYTVNLAGGDTSLVNVSDEPLFDPLSLIIEKKAEEGADKNLSLEGAEYTVKYYKDTTLTKESVANATPFRTWVFRTDKNGEIRLFDEWKIGGDELFKKENGTVVGLFGTYTIEETKAPKGFAKTEGIISLQNITELSSGSTVSVVSDVVDVEKEQTISLTINKKDSETGQSEPQGHGTLEGAVYDVLMWDKFTNEFVKVAELLTNAKGQAVYEKGKPGVYKVVETKASAGYLIDKVEKEIKAGIKEINTVNFNYDVESLEDITKVEFRKTTYNENGDLVNLEGAKIQLLKGDEVIEEFTTTKEPKVIKGLEVGATYTFKEVEAPEGYFKAEDESITIKDTKELQKVEMFDEPMGKIFLEKKLIRDNQSDLSFLNSVDFKKIKFAIFAREDIKYKGMEIYAKGSKIYESYLDEEGHFRYEKLREGKYFIKELEAPLFLAKNYKEYNFEIRYGEKANIEERMVVENKGNIIRISKTDITGQNEISGAKLTILDSERNVITSFVSKDRPTIIEGLERGKSYILKEEIAPKGYVLSKEEVEFRVGENGEVDRVIMKNKVLAIEKRNEFGEMLKGAKMEIVDLEGNVVDIFTTDNEKPYYASNLKEGETYRLRELDAPSGYEKAEDITFTVSETKDIQKIVMIDKKKKVIDTGDETDLSKYFSLLLMSFIGVMIFRKVRR